MTPAAFANCRSLGGHNSYEILAQTLSGQPSTVLDLACGNGHLASHLLPRLSRVGKIIGIDMSEEELQLARAVYKDPRITFQLARADELPLEAESVEYVLCHMAFMLMNPIEKVVAEISRILKVGGTFAAIVPGKNPKMGLLSEVRALNTLFIKTRYPGLPLLRLGDPRTLDAEGWDSLFGRSKKFQKCAPEEEIGLQVHTGPEGVWDLFKHSYFIAMMHETDRDLLKTEIAQWVNSRCASDGTVHLEYPMRKLAITKSDS